MLCELPAEVQGAIADLERDYCDLEYAPGGANGYVIFARNRISRADVAIKFYSGAPGERRHDEPRLLASIQHANVLPIIDARNLSQDWAFFITPRCGDGDLDALIAQRPSALQAIDIALGICNGASAIHAQNLIHRDLKPGNIVCHEGAPLIADFGSVRKITGDEVDVPASSHSVLYRPPESFQTGRYSVQGDVYQVGLVTYQLLGGRLPYEPEAYFRASDRKKFSTLIGEFEQSRFQDEVIRKRASSSTLMNFRTLPPWVSGIATRALRSMTHTSVSERLKSMADVAAVLSRVRAATANWRWVGEVARLERRDRTIELRPVGDGMFEPMQAKGDAFRRVPSQSNGPLRDLVTKLSGK